MTAAALGAVCGLLFFVAADHFISPPDCASYWAWALAFARDFDFSFAESYAQLSMPRFYTYITATGRVANDWPMGSGIALAPVAWLGACAAHAIPKIDEMHWLEPTIFQTLLSDYHGVLTWTPIYLPAAVGLACLARHDRVLAAGLAVALAVQLYLNSANMVWWCGGSFGNRRLSDSACIVAYGLAGLWAWRPGRFWKAGVAALVAVCCCWTLWLVLAERRMLVPLDRHVPFADPAVRTAMLRVWSEPSETLRALTRPLASSGAAGMRLGISVALAVAISTLPGAVGCLRRAHAPYAATALGALAAVILALTTTAAWRTGPVTDTEVIKGLGNSPRVLWDNYIELALYEAQRGNAQASALAAARAIEMRPGHYSGWWYLGAALFAQQKWAEAVAAFDKVIELNPGHPHAAAVRSMAASNVRLELGAPRR